MADKKERVCKKCGKNSAFYSAFWEGEMFSDCEMCGDTYHHPCRETCMQTCWNCGHYMCNECHDKHEVLVNGLLVLRKMANR